MRDSFDGMFFSLSLHICNYLELLLQSFYYLNQQRMNYQETLTFLYHTLPIYQKIGKGALKKDLTNIIAFCEYLNQPHQNFKSIHIAGTNGKGSTTHMLGAILQAKGLKVGLYTSPHYKDFRERIKINAHFISEQNIIDFVEKNEALMLEIKPSFFEITVAMAFYYFSN